MVTKKQISNIRICFSVTISMESRVHNSTALLKTLGTSGDGKPVIRWLLVWAYPMASSRHGSIGRVVYQNMLGPGFKSHGGLYFKVFSFSSVGKSSKCQRGSINTGMSCFQYERSSMNLNSRSHRNGFQCKTRLLFNRLCWQNMGLHMSENEP